MKKLFIILVFLFTNLLVAQPEIYQTNDNCNSKFSFNDFGNMWTFDSVPIDSFKARYDFEPTEQWLENAQKAALQFAGGCSAAFVSEDGLIMTNHHCARGQLNKIQKEGENLLWDGFYANNLEDERQIPGIYVDQLQQIIDVTKEVHDAFESGKTLDEKIKFQDEKIKSLEKKYAEELGLVTRVVKLYQGKKYSLYAYRRYEDVRLVMSPDFQIAATGWDWDNFTWPRYELDFMFFRAYDEDGKPVKVNHFFHIATEPIKENETTFVIGRPGRTDRLITVGELEYLRDYIYRQRLILFNSLYNTAYYLYQKYPERNSELLNRVMGMGNGRKSYGGRLFNLKNEKLLARKMDFENNLKDRINKDEKLREKYSDIFPQIEKILKELCAISNETMATSNIPFAQPSQVGFALFIYELQEQMKLDNEKRKPEFHESSLDETIKSKIQEEKFEDYQLDFDLKTTENFIYSLYDLLGENHKIIKQIFGGLDYKSAIEEIQKSYLFNYDKLISLVNEIRNNKNSSHENSFYILAKKIKSEERKENGNLNAKLEGELSVLNSKFAEAVFEIYGDQISPDATSTLRISDGKVLGYEYNGTLAPAVTTFYGLWDRYISFGKKAYPWGLHPKWQNPPKELNLETQIGFATTNDIVGGNSGSSVINKNGEVVGLVHDGNLESLAGHFIFDIENNRTVASDILGIIEALNYIYKTPRLVDELKNSKIIK